MVLCGSAAQTKEICLWFNRSQASIFLKLPMGHFHMHRELHPESRMESHRSQIQRMKVSPHFHNQKTVVNGFCLIVWLFPNSRPKQSLICKSRVGLESRQMHKQGWFQSFVVLMFHKILMNSELEKTEPLISWETYGEGSCEPLVMILSSMVQYITWFCMVLFKDSLLIH